ncbi:MAG: protein kinase, partial [Oscillospiraceae bacterium]
GSVHYISPEQARGEITDEKTDVYAIGVMLFEMLTGKLPFEATDPVSVALMQISDKPQLPREINPSIPEGLEDITIRAMQKDVSLRYQTASEMLRDIEEFKKNPHINFDYTNFNYA